MTTHQPLSLFISSKMQELADERRAVQAALAEYRMSGWLWEHDAGARPEPIRSTYLHEVEACDIYLGLFWLGYGSYTIEEFDHARALNKPCLLYEKEVRIEERSPELVAFLCRLQQVASPDGLTICRFESPAHLASQVQTDVMRLLTSRFRDSRQQPAFPKIWNVPYRRNPYFTGREDVLTQLHDHFIKAQTAALTQPLAITGLGGVGKTQIAIEYAYRYRQEYDHVLWVNAASQETLLESFVAIARLVELPVIDEQDQRLIVEAVKQWLANHKNWLLILDNADDLMLLNPFLPTASSGHFLLTTRESATGPMKRFIVQEMDETEGIELLLRRANILASRDASPSQVSPSDHTLAASIVKELDGLPLALDQAGAYIEETPSTLETYLKIYRRRHMEALQKRGNDVYQHHPVATTWSLNFAEVEQRDQLAADLLRLLAFLAPHAIPEEMLIAGASELGPQLEAIAKDETLLDKPIRTLTRFSLVQRHIHTHQIVIHRLVQAVFKAGMEQETQRQWAERTVRAINKAFPLITFETWRQYESYLPHALNCATLIDEYMLTMPEAARLLNQAAFYLVERALYEQAEPLYQRALAIREHVLGLEHPDTASSLNNLATLYYKQGKYEQAEPLYQRVLAIREQVLGPEHLDTVESLNNLSVLYNSQGKYEQAEPLIKLALAIREVLEPDDPKTASSLINLALLYDSQGKCEQAEPLYQQALAIDEKFYGPEHPEVATDLNNLALHYYNQGKYEQAEPLFKRALAIRELALGPDHLDNASSLNNLALLYGSQGKYEEGEPLYQRALAIMEKTLDSDHPDTKTVHENYARLLERMRRDKI